jgi:hypothetical protein
MPASRSAFAGWAVKGKEAIEISGRAYSIFTNSVPPSMQLQTKREETD